MSRVCVSLFVFKRDFRHMARSATVLQEGFFVSAEYYTEFQHE